MDQTFRLRRLTSGETHAAAPALAAVLADCVDGGASVSFMADMTPSDALAFWTSVAMSQAQDGRVVIVAEDDAGLFGVVEVIRAGTPNQPHRADVAKMLVHRRGRRRGVGEALMHAAEQAGREMGKTLLTLDTETGGAGERLYARLGWVRVGVIPNYALMPDGAPCATTLFYKAL